MTGPAATIVFLGGKDPFRRSGGIETFGLAHAEAAARAGFDVHWFYLSSDTAPPGERMWHAHPVDTPVRPVRALMASVHAPFVARAVERFLANVRGPVVLHAFASYASIAALVRTRLAKRGRRAGAVASVYTTLDHEYGAKPRGVERAHGALAIVRPWLEYQFVRFVASRAERASLSRMDIVLVNYESVRVLLETEYRLAVPIRRIPYVALTAFDRDAAIAHRVKTSGTGVLSIVAVSRHDPRKGVDRLIHALARLRDDGVAFHASLVGPGELLNVHRALATRLQLDACVEIVGRVESVRDYLDVADVFVLPSLEEGSGSVSLLEALQSGCALVSSNIDGIPEDVVDGVTALLVEPDDVTALGDALASLARDPALRERLGAAARALFEERFTADVLTDALRELYREVGV